MGSRWFRYVLGSMVLFFILWASRVNVLQGESKETPCLSAYELYHEFQVDRNAALKKYGGRKIEIMGVLCDIRGNGKPESLALGESWRDCSDGKLVECYLWDKRGYRMDDFATGAEMALYGHVPEKQENDWIVMEYCKVLVY